VERARSPAPALGRARNGAGQLTLIVGEPGIGKTRLIEEFRLRLGEAPHTFVELS
jgi:predicted ATPase